jgi:hypothetical protein
MLGGLGIFFAWLTFLIQLWFVEDLVVGTVEARPISDNGFVFNPPSMETRYMEKSADLHSAVARMAVGLMWFRLMVCWYVILIMFRFFRAFLAQPKLAVVTESIIKSSPDLLHFFIVLALVMLAYAVAGMFIFGQRVFQFSELHLAINQCIQVMLGNFDFDELTEEHLFVGAGWFFSYAILVNLIMLNMLLAIVMDKYSEVKGDAHDEAPFWTQIHSTFTDAIKMKDWVSYKLIEEMLSKWDDCPEMINCEDLMRQLPTIPSDQAIEMIHEADKKLAFEDEKGFAISDALKMVGWIKHKLTDIADKISDIMVLERQERKLVMDQIRRQSKGAPREDIVDIHPAADHRLTSIERRLTQMDEFFNESMCFTVHRGKEMRNRLAVIEGLVSGTSTACVAA